MLKKLITALTRKPLRQKFSPGYQTIIHSTINDPVVIHDTLDLGLAITAEQIEYISSFCHIDDEPDSNSTNNPWYDDTFSINPASGLPMADGCLDVRGNTYGTSGSLLDSDFNFI